MTSQHGTSPRERHSRAARPAIVFVCSHHSRRAQADLVDAWPAHPHCSQLVSASNLCTHCASTTPLPSSSDTAHGPLPACDSCLPATAASTILHRPLRQHNPAAITPSRNLLCCLPACSSCSRAPRTPRPCRQLPRSHTRSTLPAVTTSAAVYNRLQHV